MKTPSYKRQAGFTLVEMMIVIAIIGLLAVMAMPSYVRARDNTQVSACLNNLRQIEGAKDVFAIEQLRTSGYPVTDNELNPYLRVSMADLVEPAGGTYTIQKIGTSPTCSRGGLHAL